MPLPYARSIAEEHLYMSLHPCQCGESGTTSYTHGLVQAEQGMGSEHEGLCKGCGQPRRFVFRVPGIAPRHADRYGGPDPSQIIDAGEWRGLALAYMEEALNFRDRKAGRRSERKDRARSMFEVSLAAYQEMLKFVPAGREEMPDSAFFTDRGQRIRRDEPAPVFNRSFIEAMIDGIRRDIAELR